MARSISNIRWRLVTGLASLAATVALTFSAIPFQQVNRAAADVIWPNAALLSEVIWPNAARMGDGPLTSEVIWPNAAMVSVVIWPNGAIGGNNAQQDVG
ncbi:MAG: hypothetical protein ABI401_04405 [Candidatus Dormibacter sp.]